MRAQRVLHAIFAQLQAGPADREVACCEQAMERLCGEQEPLSDLGERDQAEIEAERLRVTRQPSTGGS